MKTLRPIHPNKGIEAKYRKELQSLIDDMIASYDFWIKAAYRKNPPVMATDELPSKTIQTYMVALAARWERNFDEVLERIVDTIVYKQIKMTDTAMRSALKDAGWSVDFKMTRAMKDIANASIAENVGLIKSIPQQFHSRVEGAVMRSYTQGHDLFTMRKDLQEIYSVTKDRASLIARDQNSKLNSATTRARQEELGIKQAIWMHSTAGKKPRPEHVAANGKTYDIEKGLYLEGKWTFPGYEINCRCTSRSVLPF
jgi:SPP1 gp7 family putative phage head morphogenesis protein